MQYWNPAWELHGAGFGYRGGVRGATRLDGDVLATYPRDEVRGVSLRRRVTLGDRAVLLFEAGADGGRAWRLNVWVDNERVDERLIEAGDKRTEWQQVRIDLAPFARRQVHIRIYQLVLTGASRSPGSAYWRNLTLE